MSDLLKEFFKRDLTEAEEQRLGKLLSSSPTHSLRFADLAHVAYLQTGLPDAGGGNGSGGFGGPGGMSHLIGPIILKSVVLLTVTGLAAYGIFRLLHETLNPSVSLPPAVIQNAAPAKSQPVIPKVISVSKPAPVAPQAPLQTLPLKALAKPGMVNPVAYDSAKKYEGLDIMVEQKSSGLLTVRALDGGKNEVRLLFAGMLKPGKWDFVWDGKMQNGEPAQPGTYQVEVQSGKDVLSKEVVIRGEAVASQK